MNKNLLRSSQRLSKLVSKRNYNAEVKNTSVIVGFILGGAAIKENQIVKQTKWKDRLEYVKRIFDSYGYRTKMNEFYNSYGKTYELKVEISKEVAEHYRHLFYPNKNKTVSRKLLNELDPTSISIWLTLNSHFADGGLSLGTLAFTKEENEIIQNYFSVVYNLKTTIRKNREKYYIHFPKKSTEVLLSKVYVPRDTQLG